jgi:hypothetical protein
MRVLKNDFVKYTREEDSAEEQEEMGWKYVHGDVFRFPALNRCAVCALFQAVAMYVHGDVFRFSTLNRCAVCALSHAVAGGDPKGCFMVGSWENPVPRGHFYYAYKTCYTLFLQDMLIGLLQAMHTGYAYRLCVQAMRTG